MLTLKMKFDLRMMVFIKDMTTHMNQSLYNFGFDDC